MTKFSKYRVLILGIFSPFAAFIFYQIVYLTLTARSANLQRDWLFRLAASAPALLIPFLFALWLVFKDRRRGTFGVSSKAGLGLAVLSVGLVALPIHDGILRSRQERNQALQGVPAPLFETADISGNPQRLADHRGQVVLVNIWATWCVPCRSEMPNLDRLYQSEKAKGLIVFGISDEGMETQKNFLKQIPVTYPLLTLNGNVPSLYRDIARYPAIFLIDRQGRLQPAPPPGEPFSTLESAVQTLLK